MIHRVTVKRSDLVLGLKPLRDVPFEFHGEEALVYREGFDLMVSLCGITCGFPVAGEWQGEVRVPGEAFLMITHVPPRPEHLTIQVMDGKFRAGSTSAPCKIQKAWRSEISLPIDATIRDILRLGLTNTSEEVERAGYKTAVKRANENLNALILECVGVLRPFHISYEELNKFIRAGLQKNDFP